jgi:hypothetical protein
MRPARARVHLLAQVSFHALRNGSVMVTMSQNLYPNLPDEGTR